MNALGRMAVAYFSADHALASGEYSVLRVRIETNQLVFVHERNIHREMTEKQIDLLQSQLSFGYIQYRLVVLSACPHTMFGK